MNRLAAAITLMSIALLGSLSCSAPTQNGDREQSSIHKENEEIPNGVRISPEGEDATEPAVAALRDGRVAAAYVVKKGEGGDLYLRTFDAASAPVTEPVRVNRIEGEVKTWYGDPPTIATDAAGKIYVGWTARYPSGAKGTILYMSVTQDGGTTFGEPTRVNDDAAPASHGMHSMAVGPDGKIYFAWLDERYLKTKRSLPETPMQHLGHATPHPKEANVEPNAELYVAISEDGKTFGANRRLAGDVCPCCKTSTVISDKGDVAIGFRKVFDGEFRHIAVTSQRHGEDAFSEPVQVSNDGWKINACPVSGPALRFEGGDLAIAWFSGGDAGPQGVYRSSSSDDGKTFVERTLVKESLTAGQPAWAGTTLFWSSENNVMVLGDTESTNPHVISAGPGKNLVATLAGEHEIFLFVVTEGDLKSVWLGRDPIK